MKPLQASALAGFLALAYAGIHAAKAALGRQMEFHADSVAVSVSVSVSGSDSLMRALHRLVFADAAAPRRARWSMSPSSV